MMTLVAAALLLAPIQYSFEPGVKLEYDSKVEFQGFIPILGGNEGTVLVEMGVGVEGLKPTKDGTRKAVNEIKEFKVTFNGAALPLDAASVQSYFPRTTISLEPTGKIVESDAPNVALPVRLPGLHVKRFPDVTYVPIEFPSEPVKDGESWAFARKFGESDINYVCKVKERKGDAALVEVSILQEYEVLEDAALEVVAEEKDAERRVKTVTTGSGIVLFDTKRGLVLKAEMVNDSVSDATKLSDGSKSQRKLRTTFSIGLKEPKPASTTDTGWLAAAWTSVSGFAVRAWEATLGWWAMARLAFLSKVAKRGG
jgi:hypothetical protein